MHPYGLEDKEIIESNMRLLPLATKSLQNSAKHHIVNVDWKKVVDIVKKASGISSYLN